MTTLFEKAAPHPLADRLRPQRLADIVGQDHLLGPEGPIGRMVASRQLASMILWGPPGCGKTTIARLLAHGTDFVFEPLSAVFSGVADLRKVFDAAKKRRDMGQGTLLFRTRSTGSTAPSRVRSCPMSKPAPPPLLAPRPRTRPSS